MVANNEEDISVPEESGGVGEEESAAGSEEEVEMESTGDSSGWRAVGSSWKSTNPQTGKEVTMKITGMEKVDGIPMFKAVYETFLRNPIYTLV